MHDLSDAVRSLRSTPVVSLMAILSLALGIGANTAIFSIVDSLFLRTLPVRDPHQLVIVRDATGRRTFWSNPMWEQIRERERFFDRHVRKMVRQTAERRGEHGADLGEIALGAPAEREAIGHPVGETAETRPRGRWARDGEDGAEGDGGEQSTVDAHECLLELR